MEKDKKINLFRVDNYETSKLVNELEELSKKICKLEVFMKRVRDEKDTDNEQLLFKEIERQYKAMIDYKNALINRISFYKNVHERRNIISLNKIWVDENNKPR